MLALETPLTGLPSALPAHLAAELAELLADAERYAAAAQTVITTRAYASHWKQFQAWCDRYQLESLPASAPVIGLYVTSLAKRSLDDPPPRLRDRPRARLSAAQEEDRAAARAAARADRPHRPDHHRRAARPRAATARVRRRPAPIRARRPGDRAPLPSPDGLRIRIARSKTDQHGRARSSWSSTPSRLGPAPIGRSEPGLAPPRSPPALSFGA